MKSRCRKIQAQLAEGGPQALREDSPGQLHLEECAECFSVLESLARLEEALEELPRLDAPDSVVKQLLARPELQVAGEASTETSPTRFWRRWRGALSALATRDPFMLRSAASLAVLLLAVGLAYMAGSFAPELQQAGSEVGWSESTSAPVDQSVPVFPETMPVLGVELNEDKDSAAETEIRQQAPQAAKPSSSDLRAMGSLDGQAVDETRQLREAEADVVGGRASDRRAAEERTDLLDRLAPARRAAKNQPASATLEKGLAIEESIAPEESVKTGGFVASYNGSIGDLQAKTTPGPQPAAGKAAGGQWVGTESDISFRGGSPRLESEAEGTFDHPLREEVGERLRERLNQLPRGLSGSSEAVSQGGALAHPEEANKKQDEEKKEVGGDVGGLLVETEEIVINLDSNQAGTAPTLAGGDPLAEIFLHERARLDGLRLQPAEGYWANTYVPGDPALRHLQASLLRRDRAALEAFAPAPLALHDAVRQPTQPFDPPESAALAVYLHADRAALEGRQRLLVQVGLQASERLGGRRPAMNLGVVLDLRGEISTASATTLRALMSALVQSRDLGDRFRLLVAGRPGGEVLGPEAFRHGPVAVTLERLLTGEATETTLSLSDALSLAAAAVRQDDDPTSPLGSSAVILITDQPLGAEAATLVGLAHRSALQGVTVSAMGVGERVALDELENLALAGQGHRRLLHLPGEATAVVERELTAVGRAVARAVRLRIRLAPGVELIDVLGSHRLDVAAAERVRQAEQSIDRRLSRNLGITTDRGEDEDGLQIVIPSFYAGDSHVVLLDVVAPGPGPIADVQVRYKDLVYFENGVARNRLTLDRGIRPAGPLERNVLKNLLATDARGVFEDAAQLLQAGDPEAARERLETFRQLLLGLGQALPNLAKDRDLERDIALLAEYVALLDAGAAGEGEARSHLTDSLRFSGRLKILPRPVTSDDS